jgi:hypothetical protein
MAVFRMEAAVTVERIEDGGIAVWAGADGDDHGMVFHPAEALRLAHEIMGLLAGQTDRSALTGTVREISIRPPADGKGTSLLTIETSAGRLDLSLGWPDLATLASTANVALNSVPPAGRG